MRSFVTRSAPACPRRRHWCFWAASTNHSQVSGGPCASPLGAQRRAQTHYDLAALAAASHRPDAVRPGVSEWRARSIGVTSSVARAGRPGASSCEMLEEAAGELFLEQGYARTSIADITQRAGVSRNTFFNYFTTKADLLWFAFDDTFSCLNDTLIAGHTGSVGVREAAIGALRVLAGELPPENVALDRKSVV